MFNLRTLLWLYLILLIFEGSVRKWIIPALDGPLLIVRDPLVVWIYIVAMQRGYAFNNNSFFTPNIFLAVCTAVLSTVFGFGNLFVTLYGLRTDFLQIPLIFLIPQVLNRDDVMIMGRYLMYAAIPIAGLALLQFRSPPDSLLNKGAFLTHYGTVRPSGPFSFIAGLVYYYSLVTSFVMYGYIQSRTFKIWLIASVTFMLLLSAACTGSRTCLGSMGIVVAVAVLCVLMRGKGGMGLIVAAVIIALLIPLLSSFSIFQEGSEQMKQRLADTAASGQDAAGSMNRVLDGYLGPLAALGDADLFGDGLGLGTNAGANMMAGTIGKFYGGSEIEWNRLTFECGPIFGLLLIIFRTALTAYLGKRAFNALREGNPLPMLIFASCALLLLSGQWGVPTTLGFAIFGGGLTLAACEVPDEEDEEHDEEAEHEEAEHASDHPTNADPVS